MPGSEVSADARKGHLTPVTAFSLIVGIQIGASIFATPSLVLGNALSVPSTAIAVWLVGGLLASMGAASLAELGVAIQVNGGVPEYIRRCWGDALGFSSAFLSVLIVQPLSMSVVSLVGAGYLGRLFQPTLTAEAGVHSTWQNESSTAWTDKVIAISMIACMTGLNCMGTPIGTGAARIFVVVKVLALVSIIISAVLVTAFRTEDDVPQLTTVPAPNNISISVSGSSWSLLGSLVDAVLAALLTYQGWENLGYVVGELRDPSRTVPRVLFCAMVAVMTLFIGTNLAYFAVVPIDVMVRSNSVGLDYGRILLGFPGAFIATLIVSVSCIGTVNAKIFAIGRLTEYGARRGYFPAFFVQSSFAVTPLLASDVRHDSSPPSPLLGSARIQTRPQTALGTHTVQETATLLKQDHTDNRPPIRAMLLNSSLAVPYILLGTFRTLVTYASLTAQIVLLLAVSGIFPHRATQSKEMITRDTTETINEAAPTYRTHIVYPVVFCSLTGFIVVRGAVQHPYFTTAVLLLNVCCVSIYRILRV